MKPAPPVTTIRISRFLPWYILPFHDPRRRGSRARRERARQAARGPRRAVGNLYGRKGRGFASTLLARLRRGERVRTDAERQLQPTWGRAVAEQTFALVTGDAPHGLYHVMCHGQTTWADWSRELARLAGCN